LNIVEVSCTKLSTSRGSEIRVLGFLEIIDMLDAYDGEWECENVCMKCKNTQRFREVRAVKAIPYVLFLLLLVSVSVSVFGCRTCLTLSEVASPALL
jgi:hypothetical protein